MGFSRRGACRTGMNLVSTLSNPAKGGAPDTFRDLLGDENAFVSFWWLDVLFSLGRSTNLRVQRGNSSIHTVAAIHSPFKKKNRMQR